MPRKACTSFFLFCNTPEHARGQQGSQDPQGDLQTGGASLTPPIHSHWLPARWPVSAGRSCVYENDGWNGWNSSSEFQEIQGLWAPQENKRGEKLPFFFSLRKTNLAECGGGMRPLRSRALPLSCPSGRGSLGTLVGWQEDRGVDGAPWGWALGNVES